MRVISETNSFQNVSVPESARLREVFKRCICKTRRNIKRLANEPKSAAWSLDGNYFNFKEGFYEIGNWTSSFFTGMALIAWQETEDEYFLNQVLRLAPHYRKKVFMRHGDTHHDLGFLYSLYSVALYKLTGDEEHREVGLRAAEVLSQRFNSRGNFIRAWGRIDADNFNNVAIIDCLMNLPLLYWASQATGNKKFRDIAVKHVDMALKNFIRHDYSVVHAFHFDLKTGQPLGASNHCGFSKDSYWSRGASWAIYGFALSYRYTRDAKYLDASLRLAKKFIAQLDNQIIPPWDFYLPEDTLRNRDASAAVIAVCGFQELAKHDMADDELLKTKRALLDCACSEHYLDSSDSCHGILKNAYGDKNAYSSWGDYFLMEALANELFNFRGYW